MKVNRQCLSCEKGFIWDARPSRIKAGWGKFCSRSCQGKFSVSKFQPWRSNIGKIAHNNRQQRLICEVCKQEYLVSPCEVRTSRFCSHKYSGKVANTWGARTSKFEKGNKPPHTGKHLIKLQGVNNPNWQGGKTKLRDQIRKSLEYQSWRVKIFQRDNYICQMCGVAEHNKINVDHHPKTFAMILSENHITTLEEALKCVALWDTENNRTLCIPCHQKTSTYFQPLSKHKSMV